MENDFFNVFYNKLKTVFTSDSESLNIESNAKNYNYNEEKLKNSVDKLISQENGFDRIKEILKTE